jgi:hypothetical protein
MMESQQAADSPPPPSPESGVVGPSPAGESHGDCDGDCDASGGNDVGGDGDAEESSQRILEEHEQRYRPLPGHEKVDGWLRYVQAANASASSPASPSQVRYPTPPAAPPKDGYIQESSSECSNNYDQRQHRRPCTPPAYIFRDGQHMFHKMYQGRQPFTFVDTGLYQGGLHDWYGVHKADCTTGMGFTTSAIWSGRIDSTGS